MHRACPLGAKASKASRRRICAAAGRGVPAPHAAASEAAGEARVANEAKRRHRVDTHPGQQRGAHRQPAGGRVLGAGVEARITRGQPAGDVRRRHVLEVAQASDDPHRGTRLEHGLHVAAAAPLPAQLLQVAQ